MNTTNNFSVLFDFDGVIMDTEPQYTIFWNKIGRDYLQEENFGNGIKGQSMTQIYQRYFNNSPEIMRQIGEALTQYEKEMQYNYVPGVLSFIEELKSHNIRVAIVTSSEEPKMNIVYQHCPELRTLTEHIFTGEQVARSKPAPDCFINAMNTMQIDSAKTFVFEDSFYGLEAARKAHTTVIGVSTTNTAESIKPYCDAVIPDFTAIGYIDLLERNIFV